MAGIMYCEVFLLAASTSANRLGSKLARETRTTAVAGNDSAMVVLSVMAMLPPGNDSEIYHPEITNKTPSNRRDA
jgi:hypothetical protein